MLSQNDQDDRISVEGSPSVNLIPPLLGVIGIGALVYVMSIIGFPPGQGSDDIAHCAHIAEGPARLACYDKLVRPLLPAKGAVAPAGPHEREKD